MSKKALDKQVKKAVKTKVVKATRPAAKSINKPAPSKPKVVKSLQLKVKLQTAEGWKRGVLGTAVKKAAK